MGFKTYTCPIAKNCGGCEWLAVPYSIQLSRKQGFVENALGSMAKEDGSGVTAIRGMDTPLHFRYKAQTPFAPGPAGRVLCGLYSPGTHHIVRCKECLVEDPRIRPILNDVAYLAHGLSIPAYQEDRGRGVLRAAVARAAFVGNGVMLTIVANGERLGREDELVRLLGERHPCISTVVLNTNKRKTNAILGRPVRTLRGSGVLKDRLCGCTFEIGPTSFYQTNPRQTEPLYNLAVAGGRLESGMRVLDAYCGCGTIGICACKALAKNGSRIEVVGVDQVGEGITLARRNARANGVEASCSFVEGDATAYMSKLASGAGRGGQAFDVVVMDPPRAGATRAFLQGLSRLAPERVVYVSCNVDTQARDIAFLRKGGYRIESVSPVDMFPHTKHVECVAVLSHR